jgi:hypothetical protein
MPGDANQILVGGVWQEKEVVMFHILLAVLVVGSLYGLDAVERSDYQGGVA